MMGRIRCLAVDEPKCRTESDSGSEHKSKISDGSLHSTRSLPPSSGGRPYDRQITKLGKEDWACAWHWQLWLMPAGDTYAMTVGRQQRSISCNVWRSPASETATVARSRAASGKWFLATSVSAGRQASHCKAPPAQPLGLPSARGLSVAKIDGVQFALSVSNPAEDFMQARRPSIRDLARIVGSERASAAT